MRKVVLSSLILLALSGSVLGQAFLLGDLGALPEPVEAKRDALYQAAIAGDFDLFSRIVGSQPEPPLVSYGGADDAVEYLRDAEPGGEPAILAILADLLAAPHGELDDGAGGVIYAWPSLSVLDDISELAPAQVVEGMRIMGADAFRSQQMLGYWIYWRIGMDEKGNLLYFVAGD